MKCIPDNYGKRMNFTKKYGTLDHGCLTLCKFKDSVTLHKELVATEL